MIKSERILIGCKPTEGNRDFSYLETEYLFKTLSKFSGSLANSIKLACFNEQPDAELVKILTEIDVKIKIVEPVDVRNPAATKYRVIDEAKNYDVDIVVMLDTDIVITGDFSEYLDVSSIKAKPEDADLIGLNGWKDLFEYFGLQLPKERFKTSCTPEEIIPYFNSGVVIIPIKYASSLFKTWKNFHQKLCDERYQLPASILARSRFFDQFALSLAISKMRFPFNPLPLRMNYPFSGPVNPSENPENLDPLLIHHHHCITEEGEIMHCPYENINKKIDEINSYLKQVRKLEIINEEISTSPVVIRNLTQVHRFNDIIKRLPNLPLDSKNADLQYYLALSFQHAGINLEEAVIRYNHALENGFEPFMVYSDRGSLYFTLGDIENARKDLMMAYKIKPYDLETKRRISLLDERVTKIKELADECRFLDVINMFSNLPLDSENAYLQYYLALSLHHAGKNLNEVLVRYNKAFENGFDSFWIYFNRGSLYYTLGDIENARKDLMRAHKIKPDDTEVKRKLSLLG